MDTKKTLTLLALLIGEAIIIAGFVLFAGHWENSILALNILVVSLIYGLCFAEVLSPWGNFSNPSQQKVGSLGLRWFSIGLYAICAIGVMVAANLFFLWTFFLQLLVQGGLISLLLLSVVSFLLASDKVAEVHTQQALQRNGISNMKKAIQALKNSTEKVANLPESLNKRILSLEENLRLLSPAHTAEAQETEQLFMQTAEDMLLAMPNYALNKDTIEGQLLKLERLFQDRKKLYSN